MSHPQQVPVCLSATFTVDPLSLVLESWLAAFGLTAEVKIAGFQQVHQQLLDPGSLLSCNRGGVNVVLVRGQDLAVGTPARGRSAAREIGAALAESVARNGIRTLVVACPCQQAQVAEEVFLAELREQVGEISGAEFLDASAVARLYQVEDAYDLEAEVAAAVPYTDAMYRALGTWVSRRLLAGMRKPIKVIAVDADHTLWTGVVGEVGASGVEVGPARRAFQKFLLECRSQGHLLCLVSKNHPDDVEAVFREHPDMVIGRDAFVESMINWEPKSSNLRQIAARLNLGLDAFLFLDDSPAEIAEVAANAPAVMGVRIPENEADLPAFLQHLWVLDRHDASAEDVRRADFYHDEAQRRALRERTGSYEEFISGLDLRMEIVPLDDSNLGRASQLTRRTNQFNSCPRPRDEAKLRESCRGMVARLVEVRDRFGDYGAVGLMIFREDGGRLWAETFLLSCRALGKGVEQRMLRYLGDFARELQLEEIAIWFSDSGRNQPVREFLEGLPGRWEDELRIIPAALARQCSLVPSALAGTTTQAVVGEPVTDAECVAMIAHQLRTAEAIGSWMAEPMRPRPEISERYVDPVGFVEERIAAIWAGVLNVEKVGRHDRFVDLGGNSLQLVRVHAQVQREFGKPFELVRMFEHPTVEEQAQLVVEEVEPTPTPVEATPELEGREALAIVGMAVRLPGANTPEELWENLRAGVESIEVFDAAGEEVPGPSDDPAFVRARGLLKPELYEGLDGGLFGILPREAEIIDPQQRVFLELCWEALERGGYRPDAAEEEGGRVGIYAGCYYDTYLPHHILSDPEMHRRHLAEAQVGALQVEFGNDKDHLATRVAFKLNLKGPSLTVQTACSSSLVAVGHAAMALRSGHCDMALAGGITITVPQKRGYHHEEGGMLSRDGHCRPFDAESSGTVFSNGGGVVLLKRLADAVRDGDTIHAVIRGYGLNNDGGTKHSYAAPSVDGQADAIRRAHLDAGVDPRTITYVEAHGTATPLGDPIEIAGLTAAFRKGTEDVGFCAVGSLKSNLGHLDTAAGVCGLIKTALSLQHGELPPVLHFKTPNPRIDWAQSPFFVNDTLRPWVPATGSPRRAGVSSFGVGGTNAHVILEEAPRDVTPQEEGAGPRLWVLSGRTEKAVDDLAEKLGSFAAGERKESFSAAARTLALGRKPMALRTAVVARDWADLGRALSEGRMAPVESASSAPGLVWMFPGQGAQHPGMTADLYAAEAGYRADIDFCADFLEPLIGEDLRASLFAREGDEAERLTHTVLAQPAIFAVEWALARQWARWGVLPELMMGHSVGEFTAACLAGVFSIEDGLRLLAARGELMGSMPGGSMLSVRLSAEKLRARLPDSLDLAAVNGPELVVVAGERDTVADFAAELEADGIQVRELHTSHAFHSRMMDPVIARFRKTLESMRLHPPKMPILSTVTGQLLTDEQAMDPGYWASHLRQTVDFHGAVVAAAEKEGRLYLEVGPGQTLTTLSRQSVGRRGKGFVASCHHPAAEGSDHERLLLAAGELWAHGAALELERFHGDAPKRRVPLPTYPFQRRRAWLECRLLDRPVERLAPLPKSETVTDLPQIPAVTATVGMLDQVREVLEGLSGIPGEEMEPRFSFLELGFDSLLLTQAARELQKAFGVPVAFRDLMQSFPTLERLVAHLEKNAVAAPRPQPVVVSAAIPPEGEVAPMSAPADMLGRVREVLEGLSGIPAAEMSPHSGFLELGFDSLLLTQAARELQKAFGVPIAFRDLMQAYPTLGQLVEHLEAQGVPVSAVKSASAVVEKAVIPAPPAAPEEESGVSGPRTRIDRSQRSDELTPPQRAHLDQLILEYCEKTKTSKSKTQEYRPWHADPRTVNGFNRLYKEMVYQIVATRMQGCKMWDVDGNEYIDMVNGFGPNFLGHAPEFVTSAIQEALATGLEIGPQCETAMECSKLFCEVTGNERVCFLNTGSEAVQAAMRIARTVTGRDKVLVFDKDYHGNFDPVLVRSVGKGARRRTLPLAPGIPDSAVGDVIVVPWGKPEALDMIREVAHELAAVLVEPVQSRQPELIPIEFVHEVKKIAEESGFLLVFDEVITGIRQGPGGAQALYGIRADLATYGKVFGGGALPIGIIGGKAKYMDTFDGGQWQYGDESFPEKEVTFFAGTFVRLPLAMAACRAVLRHVKEQPKAYWETIGSRADRLAGTVDRLFRDHGIDVRMVNFNSQMYLRVGEGEKHGNLIYYHLRKRGVFAMEGLPFYLTAAHSDADVDRVIEAFRETIAALQDGGFFPRLTISTETEAAPGVRGPFPMTEPMSELWLASLLGEEANLAFNEMLQLRLEGTIDLGAVRAALQDLVDRHDALRLRVPSRQAPQFVIDSRQSVEILEKDFRGEADGEGRLMQAGLEQRETPFDLETGPVFRVVVARLREDRTVLQFVAHHLAADGWSFEVLMKDFKVAYEARKAGMKPIQKSAPSIVDRALREHQQGGAPAETLAWWKERFAGGVKEAELPLEKAYGAAPVYRSSTCELMLDAATAGRLKELARKCGATLNSTLLGGFEALVHRLTGQSEFVLTFPSAGQMSSGEESLVGHCVNFLPLPAQVDPEASFKDLVARASMDQLDVLEHGEVTYGELLRTLKPVREGGRRPMMEIIFNLEPSGDPGYVGNLRAKVETVPARYSNSTIFLNLMLMPEGMLLSSTFNCELIDEGTMRAWLECLRELLLDAAKDPSCPVGMLQILSADANARIESWSQGGSRVLPVTVSERFQETARLHAARTALVWDGGEMNYHDLALRVSGLAGALLERGVEPGDRVGVLLDRGPERVIAQLAVLQAGACYVPLEASFPSERRREILDQCEARIVLSRGDGEGCDVLDPTTVGAGESPLVARTPQDPAYVMFTSGSTGEPKGVVVPHSGIVRLVTNTRYCQFGPEETFLHAAAPAFDASTFEIFGALLHGARLVLPGPGDLSLAVLGTLVREKRVTTLWLTAGLFELMVDEHLADLRGLKQFLVGGDVVSMVHARRAMQALPDTRLINGYGPTENTTFTTARTIRESDLMGATLPIGSPIGGTFVEIVDAGGRRVPVGVPGELLTGGAGLALGYLGRPDLTEERFASTDRGRIYRTGDLCRWRADGSVAFIGRRDHQVKVRGFRIELAEIEACLQSCEGVRQSKVVVRGKGAADKRLLAWYVAPESVAEEWVRQKLVESLPAFMVPDRMMRLDALPVNANGKVDVTSLPEPGATRQVTGMVEVPDGDTEIRLASIWREILGVSEVHRHDDFFEMGGNSLGGLRMFARIHREFGAMLPLATLLRARTVSALALAIDEANRHAQVLTPQVDDHLAVIQSEGERAPLYAIHGGDGGILFYRELAERLPSDRPFKAIESPDLGRNEAIQVDTIEETAARYVEMLRADRPEGPYLLAGYSYGGVVAYEMARQLVNAGQEVPFVGLFDTINPAAEIRPYALTERVSVYWNAKQGLSLGERILKLANRFAEGVNTHLRVKSESAAAHRAGHAGAHSEERAVLLREAHEAAMDAYRPGPFHGRLHVFRAAEVNDKFEVPNDYGWGPLVDQLEMIDVPGEHLTLFEEGNVAPLADRFNRCLHEAPGQPSVKA
ncbi:amino acid adenylation domain-containing protein/FkbH-like protein [Haloferula luteola]|uniref:Amino acid adenylation domain-containing protein/FkbH-like protein n=1 Tax=Haloferula luteola TaxID=595692 RepID=A0A840V0H2_9BACT|nr:non-ribosomal peptide synthetase/type I polyketide synthase [Haloferula luteola]MBB5351502.1 amino acid adenylation domain-containing protein/FkbH-like protein [Haloferula luteola]